MKAICFALVLPLAGAALGQQAVTIENDLARWVIGTDGRNVSFFDKAAGKEYVDAGKAPFAMQVQKAGKTFTPSALAFDSGGLVCSFGDAGVIASVGVDIQPHYVRFEVQDVQGEGVESLTFLDAALQLAGKLDEPFAACALALNLQTNVPQVPGPNSRLQAMCYPRFGMKGAKVAVIACPMPQLRDIMKEVVSVADELPRSNIGGPWALDAEINRGSYLFDFGDLTEQTVDAWIAFVKTLGLNQIDFHTGTSLRFGDCFPNPKLFPNGRASVKAVTDKLHAAGISAGLHTYAFFIAKNTPYVTPVPDPRLGKDAAFTLAEPLSLDATTVPVAESTEKMHTTTGFFVRNSVTIQIDDELITYSEVSKQPPCAFTQCVRGALGTKAAEHAAGAKVHHLKECFGLFTPDADSTLLKEVAKNTADTFNECGFDMIYLDALDGEDILGGSENSWHYGSKFVFEIANRLEKPALFEMSTFHHHLWCVRARMGAWDHPSRSHKRFIDSHLKANQGGAGMFLPMNLGWWAVKTWDSGPNAPQLEPTYPDDIEYLMGKCLGAGMGISLMGVNPGNIDKTPAYQRLAPIFRQYEDLRHAGYFSEEVKARLRVPGDEFTLEQTGDGVWRFRPVEYTRHKVLGIDGWSNKWISANKFGEQPAQFRIEALMAAAPYDDPGGVVVEDFANPDALDDRAAEERVTAKLEASTEQVKTGAGSGKLTGVNERPEAAGAWAKIGKVYKPYLDIGGQRALGVWVYGDGSGALLNVQLRSPEHTTNGGMGDHYVVLDFTGWRYFELIEMEGARIEEFSWPYGGGYAVYREMVDYKEVEKVSLWYNNLPPGQTVTTYVSPIKAIPLVSTKLINPSIMIAGKTVTFPVEIESGQYLEFRSMTDCKLYGQKGELISQITPQGEAPMLTAGENAVEFNCTTPEHVSARAYVTLIGKGEPL
ncbi:MAG TPA: hypothetical protein VMZ06_16915 [Candidatus Bathyarchaeia archaeon]|nr:hypothetical protein [Candidatus Bathyarchaeia archaeon]